MNTKTDPLTMRVAPGLDFKAVGSILRGAQVTVIGYRATRMVNGYWWTTVKYNGKMGFVTESYLSSSPVIAATGKNSGNSITSNTNPSGDSRRSLLLEDEPNSTHCTIAMERHCKIDIILILEMLELGTVDIMTIIIMQEMVMESDFHIGILGNLEKDRKIQYLCPKRCQTMMIGVQL